MSKIARLPIVVPNGITVSISEDKKFVTVASSGARVSYPFHDSVELIKDEKGISFKSVVKSRTRTVRSVVGSIHASVKNAISDVQSKFSAKVNLKGVGYKAAFANGILTLSLGFSHPVKIAVPKDVEIKVTQNTLIELFGYDRRNVMSIATSIRNLRKPEPYKGKGVFINDETITIKEGKKK